MSQLQMFRRRVVDELGIIGGVTGARLIRADDAMLYVLKDDAPPDAPTVRASEYLWLSVARAVGLAAPHPEVIEDLSQRPLVATRKEHSAIGRDFHTCLMQLLSGSIHDGGTHLSRIYAFDLFCANWDRHPGNYLVLNEGEAAVAFAIDFSHVTLHPALAGIARDPLLVSRCATRAYFPQVAQPYGGLNVLAATDMMDRLCALQGDQVDAILNAVPDAWMDAAAKADVGAWWTDGRRATRVDQIKQGLQNGII